MDPQLLGSRALQPWGPLCKKMGLRRVTFGVEGSLRLIPARLIIQLLCNFAESSKVVMQGQRSRSGLSALPETPKPDRLKASELPKRAPKDSGVLLSGRWLSLASVSLWAS